ncbi:GTP-binding protein Di-Ras2 [Aplysia californica]|uniref:GTP-binding protein Di-Ras2 n=1 Tax=Aplysia californica TaxID=6500 RepID=A0ABM1VR18_APLCA|nr:GTP-binding protein Di-Ras2 [Aplysia californica]
MADTDQRNRIVFLGSGRVGKTAILKRFLFNTYSEEYKETVEDLFARDYNIRGSLIKVDFLDTAGNFVFPAMKRLSITTAHAFVLVYSITSVETFEEVKRLWAEIQEARSNYQELPCVIVGTMMDLENSRQVEKFDTLNWIYSNNFAGGFVEVSAKEDENIEDIFRLLLDQSRGESRHMGPLSHVLSTRRRSANSLDESEPEKSEEWDSDAKNFNRSRSLVRRGSKPKVKRTHRRGKHDCRVS